MAAEDLYRTILEAAPDHADALHFSGVLAHQQARSDHAVALIERSIALEPEQADWYSNLGIVLQDQLKLDEAIDAYCRAIALDPSHANALSNLGVVLSGEGRAGRGRSGVPSRDPHRSRTLRRVPQPRRAAERPEAHARSGAVLFEGDHAEAEGSGGPSAAGARALHARRSGQGGARSSRSGSRTSRTIPSRGTCSRRAPVAMCPRARRTRSSRRRSTASLPASTPSSPSCCTGRPSWWRRCWPDQSVEASKSLDILDAGCGTGLCGALLSPYARRLVGVDLSDAHARPGPRTERLRQARQG